MEQLFFIDSPVGRLGITATDKAVTRIFFAHREHCALPENEAFERCGSPAELTPVLRQAIAELEAYFAGSRREFTLPLAPVGTPFQHKVWQALQTIPYGETRSYGQIAAQAGNPRACRAVGMANNRNPLVIVVPCHRVVGSDGSLTGYAGGLEVKKFLLQLEKAK